MPCKSIENDSKFRLLKCSHTKFKNIQVGTMFQKPDSLTLCVKTDDLFYAVINGNSDKIDAMIDMEVVPVNMMATN